jgi:predicted transcriptional regulator
MIWTSFPSFSQIFNAFKYRDRMTIVSDILKTVKDSRSGKRKTQIMQSANLNYIQLDKYMRYLLKCGFLRITDKGRIYITEEGGRFLLLLEYRKTLATL